MIILLTGPAGSGKSTLAKRIAQNLGWIHLSEDELWNEIGHPPHRLRDERGQGLVHSKAYERIDATIRQRQHVVLEFLVYEDPPIRIAYYQRFLESRQIPFVTRVLQPNVETILERQRVRGRPSDVDRERRRIDAEHQLRCLRSDRIAIEWVIDTTTQTVEQTYSRHFAHLVESPAA